MKTSIFSGLAVLLLTLMALVTVSCKEKISKADLEYRVGQSISENFLDDQLKEYGSRVSREELAELARVETKVSLIKESENKYKGDAILEVWEPDQHGGDGPGEKVAEKKYTVTVTVDTDDGSFRWELDGGW